MTTNAASGRSAAVGLGAFAYTALFGLVHLLSRRGLIAGLALLAILDGPLGRLPFSLRNLSPSYHVGVIADRQDGLGLPVSLDLPAATSIIPSMILLITLGAVFTIATALVFKRKNLGELC